MDEVVAALEANKAKQLDAIKVMQAMEQYKKKRSTRLNFDPVESYKVAEKKYFDLRAEEQLLKEKLKTAQEVSELMPVQ